MELLTQANQYIHHLAYLIFYGENLKSAVSHSEVYNTLLLTTAPCCAMMSKPTPPLCLDLCTF